MWPLSHAAALLSLRNADPPKLRPVPLSDGAAKPSWGPLTYEGVLGMHWGDLFYGGLGLAIWYFSWPAESEAKVSPLEDPTWALKVAARNLLLLVPFYEFWHQLQFGCLATPGITGHRYSEHSPYEPKAPGGAPQMSVNRERFWCTCGFVWSSAWECFVVHLWATGAIPKCSEVSLAARGGSGLLGLGCQMGTPDLDLDTLLTARTGLWIVWFVAAGMITTQFRGIHFFTVHRGMHPWFKRGATGLRGQLDLGRFLYKWVHSLHHKSYNPGPWSSLSMHPVEHLFYFSCFLLAALIPYHPVHLLLNKYHTDISALGGHDGYGPPGADDVGHYLHHKHFEW
eukprot:SAG22_NODE_71_length_22540_cov_8.918052_13_plen_340_part_00